MKLENGAFCKLRVVNLANSLNHSTTTICSPFNLYIHHYYLNGLTLFKIGQMNSHHIYERHKQLRIQFSLLEIHVVRINEMK